VKEEQCISAQETDALYERLLKDAAASVYFLNRDVEFAKDLVRSLILNNRRYGYPACPCRLASGRKEDDLDIICPCDYRDADLDEFGACYCALYVSHPAYKGECPIRCIPERRPLAEERKRRKPGNSGSMGTLPMPVWRCKVCGYLCAREDPPGLCPICKAGKERFERFI
jgi:ferredoxin-thioredoxin reductase catalytic subunit/rubredoxin